MIHILHICADYSQQKLYRELILELSKKEIKQTVYVPVRSTDEIGRYSIYEIEHIEIIYANILTKKHRLLYKLKINTILTHLKENVDLSDIDLVHAHFLFSDGGVALKINKEYGIPYVVAVRNTDVNVFFKYMIHLRGYGKEIINSAKEVIFITPAYRSLVVEKYLHPTMAERILSAPIIPNGLNPIWFDDNDVSSRTMDYPIKLLYVGDFSKNKNVLKLITAVKKLSKTLDVHLTLAGGGGNGHESVLKKLKQKGFGFASYVGRINDFSAMKELYQSHHIFIMISKLETFGLVYIEAMSQGLPVIHTKGQGIDGYFENSSFAIPVNPNDKEDIINGIERIINTNKIASNEAMEASKSFLWSNIAHKYFQLYTKAL